MTISTATLYWSWVEEHTVRTKKGEYLGTKCWAVSFSIEEDGHPLRGDYTIALRPVVEMYWEGSRDDYGHWLPRHWELR